MPVHTPGRVLLHKIPLKFVRNRVAGGGRKGVDASIALVPFIDFLMVVVIFLLMSFSASGELLAQQPSITMPKASNAENLEPAPVIAVDSRVVTLDGRRMADTQTLAAKAEVTRSPVEQLIQDLETIKRNWSVLHPNKPFDSEVILQADQDIDFRVIKKIMFAAGQAGYANVSFAVNKEAE
jgi:biopolymer transport protein ExbD